jgi:putative transposase
VSRYLLYPSPEQEAVLREHCAHARYVWNLAWNSHQFGTLETYGKASRRVDREGNEYIYQKRRPVRPLPTYVEQARMLTEARAEYAWLAAGAQNVQQQALRDFSQAMRNFYAGTHAYPGRRKRYLDEGFRITDFTFSLHVRRLNRRWGQVRVPKVGWVRFRWTRPVPECKSYRITLDHAGRWHVAFTVVPEPIPAPRTGETVGVDRGVVITAALSTGEKLHCPGISSRERARLRKAERRKARASKGSPGQQAERARIARLRAREADRRKDWCEKVSTDLARRFDLIRFEDLRIKNMTRSAKGTARNPGRNVAAKSGLNRAILAQGWGLLVRRTQDKAPGRVETVRAAYTSLRCSVCGWIDKNSRDSQAGFRCTACGFTCNADINASINIAAGHAGGTPASVREPQLLTSLTEQDAVGIPGLGRGGCQGASSLQAHAIEETRPLPPAAPPGRAGRRPGQAQVLARPRHRHIQ